MTVTLTCERGRGSRFGPKPLACAYLDHPRPSLPTRRGYIFSKVTISSSFAEVGNLVFLYYVKYMI